MSILIFLLILTSCLIYYGSAAGNTNQIELVSIDETILGETVRQKRGANGGETEQDPNAPKYQKMAEDLVRNNLRIKTGDVKNIKVIRVTTQVVEGTITRIVIRITLVNGKSDQCNFKVWDKPRPYVRSVSYTCLAQSHQKTLSGISDRPRPKQTRDPKDPKYQKLAKTSIDYFFKTAAADRTFNIEDITKINVNNAKVQIIGSKIITDIQFNIISLKNDKYLCTSTIMEEPWNPEGKAKVTSVKCELVEGKKLLLKASPGKVTHSESDDQLNLPGGQVHENPDDPQYKQLASESFQRYLNSHHNVKVHVKSIKVKSVTSQVVAGTIIRIHFNVYPIGDLAFMCQSKIFQELSGRYSDFDVSCGKEYGGEMEQDPDKPQFQQLAKESFRKYRETHIGPLFVVKELKVTRATTQVVAGIITRLDFYVTTTEGRKLTCNSDIFEKSWKQIKNIHVNCTRAPKGNNVKPSVKQSSMSKLDDQLNLPGGQVHENPDDPQYKQLASESFQRYLNSHQNVKVHVKSIKVKSVTSQVVAGTIIRIHFNVYPIGDLAFMCQSKIFQELSGRYSDFDVSCGKEYGGEMEQDPDKPQFQQLAKESFRKYRETHIGPLFVVKELKVTRATTQVVAGIITRLDFYVTTTDGRKLTCNSDIFEKSWKQIKNIHVNCSRAPKGNNVKPSVKQSSMSKLDDQLKQPGGIVYENPDDPPYQQLANESFQRYLNSHRNLKIHLPYIRIDSVSSQLVAGTIVRMHFHVFTAEGRYVCKSKIFQELSGRYSDFDVSCHKESGDEEEKDPDDPQFQQLAKESFRKYQETHKGPQFAEKELKVTRVTTVVNEGLDIRIDFYVINTEGEKLACRSNIFEQWWDKYKTIDVNCNRVRPSG